MSRWEGEEGAGARVGWRQMSAAGNGPEEKICTKFS